MDPLPTGKYHVAITDVEAKESGPNAKNPGSTYLAIEMTVQSGPYEGRKLWTNATLVPHALYTIKGILEAIGFETTGNELDFEADDLMNKELIVRAIKKPAGTVKNSKGEAVEVDERNEVKSFYKLSEGEAAATNGGVPSRSGSLLP
jgi:hypothetical protein